jgi:hypothetical protein
MRCYCGCGRPATATSSATVTGEERREEAVPPCMVVCLPLASVDGGRASENFSVAILFFFLMFLSFGVVLLS